MGAGLTEGQTGPCIHNPLLGEVMKKVILAVLLTAFALFLVLPSLSWAQEDLYKAKCAGCHGADGKATAAGKKMGSPEFSSPTVQKAEERRVGKECRSRWSPSH